MPPKKNPDGDSVDENVGSVTMTNEQFRELLNSIQQSVVSNVSRVSQNVPLPVPVPTEKAGNFSTCTARFDGESTSSAEAFLDSISTFKECANVSDEHALRGLPMLLQGAAATWYQGVKTTLKTWKDAVDLLRQTYARKIPPFKVYRQLFSVEQGDTKTEIFISNARALIAQLPYVMEEKISLDMVYGLLSRRVRERIPRCDVNTFDELLVKTRSIEMSLDEDLTKSAVTTEAHFQSKINRIRCAYCKIFGHHINDCKKKQKLVEKPNTSGPNVNAYSLRPAVSCYGCGAPGVIRSKCTRCSSTTSDVKPATTVKTENFCGVDIEQSPIPKKFGRPVLPVRILGYNGVAIADTGATRSIAGETLYELLKRHCQFSKQNLSISLADGKEANQEVLTTNIEIELASKCIPMEIIVLPNAKRNNTLLGIDFLKKAEVCLDTSRQTWAFSDNPSFKYPYANEVKLCEEDSTPTALADIPFLSLRPDEGALLSNDEKDKLSRLLEDNRDIFALGGEPTPFAEHCIDTGDHVPISVPPYRMAPGKREVLKLELNKLLDAGVIEECESPWSAPVVLVPKKDGGVRLCVDYRGLNAVTKADSYPLPRMDDLLHSTKRTYYMSTMDLRAGYHQVKVRDADRDKTAFVTPFGTFRYLSMSFGLRNAPATFQRLIDRFRSGLPNVQLLAYLDDLIILSETFDSHLSDLQAVFDRLRLYKLRANRGKCTFFSPHVKYLGHVITNRGIEVDPEKTSAITNRAEPRNCREVVSFLQTCSWYRRFIPNFAEVSRPLSELTKKSAVFRWEKRQQDAFIELKSLLTTAPILRQSDETKPYILRTDSSSYAIGAVLLQGEGTDEHPVEYASRLLTSSERNWSTTEREALAIVWALERFRGYIEGCSVTISSDHQPLKWLMSLKSPSGRLARWALLIQGYNAKIEYLPGRCNVVADTLSRPPQEPDTVDAVKISLVEITIPGFSATDLRKEQLKDPDLAKIVESFEDVQSDAFSRWTERGFILSNGILYRYSSEDDLDEAQLVIPSHERDHIMREYHDKDTAAHYGAERTYQRIARRYYWTGMRRYITEYVKRCPECQRYKASNQKPAGLVQTPIYNQRFEVLAIDLFGPLPEVDAGEKWIFIVEDTSSKWVELFALKRAGAEECAKVLIDEVFLRYGLPRKIVSDNGTQFISAIMQKVCFCFDIKQSFTPVYHPQANMVERKNRDLKPRLAILVGNSHKTWVEKLPAIRFAMNTAHGETIGSTAAYLTFGRELRTPDDVAHDVRNVVQSENFLPQITPHLQQMMMTFKDARDVNERQQDRQKVYADSKRRDTAPYAVGDRVLVTSHTRSSASKGVASKLNPRRDGPYVVLRQVSPSTYEVASEDNTSLGTYHVSALTPYAGVDNPQPVVGIRRRGRPKKIPASVPGSSSGRIRSQRGSV